jgi:hypothetical protein
VRVKRLLYHFIVHLNEIEICQRNCDKLTAVSS